MVRRSRVTDQNQPLQSSHTMPWGTSVHGATRVLTIGCSARCTSFSHKSTGHTAQWKRERWIGNEFLLQRQAWCRGRHGGCGGARIRLGSRLGLDLGSTRRGELCARLSPSRPRACRGTPHTAHAHTHTRTRTHTHQHANTYQHAHLPVHQPKTRQRAATYTLSQGGRK